jgi:hypothetical protein
VVKIKREVHMFTDLSIKFKRASVSLGAMQEVFTIF